MAFIGKFIASFYRLFVIISRSNGSSIPNGYVLIRLKKRAHVGLLFNYLGLIEYPGTDGTAKGGSSGNEMFLPHTKREMSSSTALPDLFVPFARRVAILPIVELASFLHSLCRESYEKR